MYSNDRTQMRHYYFETWKKFKAEAPLTDLERQIVGVIVDHPEYQPLFDQPDKYLDKDYLPEFGETNPYMHLGLHLSLRDQISTDRPAGTQQIFEKLCRRYSGPLEAEHAMLECLALVLWQAMQTGKEFNIEQYVESLQRL